MTDSVANIRKEERQMAGGIAKAHKCADAIRNEVKQAYALDIITATLLHKPMPIRPNGLSYMAAQAVRLQLGEYLTGI